MKKLISLFLVLVLSVSLFSTAVLADDPAMQDPIETTQADAGVKVTSDSDSTVCYFETLNQDVLAWTCLNIPGTKTITLQKDLELTGAIEGFNYFLKIPNDQSSWQGRNGTKYPLVIDLNGKTITYTGSSILFYLERYGFTLKNGTVIYKSDSADNAILAITGPDYRTAFTNGATVWTPSVNLKNVKLYNISEQTAPVILNYEFSPIITIEDSVLWANTGAAIDLRKTTQNKMNDDAARYEGDYMPQITVDQSVLGSGKGVPFTATNAGTVFEMMDSTVVSGAEDGKLVNDEAKLEVDTKGLEPEIVDGWATGSAAGQLKGKAYLYGDAAMLPFIDVEESQWYYSFVKELYFKGIVAGQTADTFNPNGNLTYAAALKLLVVGLTGKDPGNATGSHWATNYLTEATTAGWTAIGADKLDAPITREAFCEIAAKAKNLTEQPAENKFTDTTNTAVLALVKAGVINGMNETTFAPANVLTRAQISKIISLLLKL